MGSVTPVAAAYSPGEPAFFSVSETSPPSDARMARVESRACLALCSAAIATFSLELMASTLACSSLVVMHWRQFWTPTSGRVARISARIVFLRGGEVSSSARGKMRTIGAHGGDWQTTKHLAKKNRQFDPRECYEEPSRVGGRDLVNVANEPYRPQAPRGRHTGRGATSTQSTLMAGRRRRTAAAALLSRPIQYICRSSSRSTGRGRRLRWKK